MHMLDSSGRPHKIEYCVYKVNTRKANIKKKKNKKQIKAASIIFCRMLLFQQQFIQNSEIPIAYGDHL